MDTINTSQPKEASQDNGKKKELLQRLISNLLDKPGRSVNEIINGVKAAIGAYKNYAKEWDALNGVVSGATDIGKDVSSIGAPMGAMMGGAIPSANNDYIKNIMSQIEKKKSVAQQPPFNPSLQTPPALPQNNMPPIPQNNPSPIKPNQQQLIAGQNGAPTGGVGILGF